MTHLRVRDKVGVNNCVSKCFCFVFYRVVINRNSCMISLVSFASRLRKNAFRYLCLPVVVCTDLTCLNFEFICTDRLLHLNGIFDLTLSNFKRA